MGGELPTGERLNTGLDSLDRSECLRLLGTEQVGRLVMVDNGRPEIFPVNYVLHGDGVLFRTDVGTKLGSSTGRPVAFEVDHIDPNAGPAWSVVIHGTAQRIDASGRENAMAVGPSSWVVSTKPHLVRITPTEITGRRINAPRHR